MKRLGRCALMAILLGVLTISGHRALAQPRPAPLASFAAGLSPTEAAVDEATNRAPHQQEG